MNLKHASSAAIIVTALGAGLCWVGLAGCASAPAPKNPPSQSEYFVTFGRSERSLWPREFLVGYKKELEQLVAPGDLQRWAVDTANAVPEGTLPKKVDATTLPKLAEGKKLNRNQMVITVASDEFTRRRVVVILDGGSDTQGWYGLKVGAREFRPADTEAQYLEWIPGVYLFLATP